MKNRRISSHKEQRGIALMLVLFVVFIEAVLGFAAISMATLDSQTASQESLGMLAHDAARAGIMRAIDQLSNSANWNTWAQSSSVKYNLQNATYTVTVTPGANNSTSSLKYWQVTSVGVQNGVQRTCVAWLTLQSFADYAYFTNTELASGGSPIYFIGADYLTGLVHTNGYFSLIGTPQFSTTVTSANTGDPDYTATPSEAYSQGGTHSTNNTQFYHYDTSYTVDHPVGLNNSPNFSFAGGQASITYPSNINSVVDAVPTPSGSSGVVTSGSSITVNGSASFTFNSNGTVTIAQSGQSNQTVSTIGTTIYCSGTATVTGGTMHGNATLGAANGINIDASVVYSNKSSDVLGLVSPSNITVTATNVNSNFEIDASIMSTGGSFTVANYNSGNPRGTLTIYGGLIQSVRGAVGTGTTSGQVDTGYSKNYVYDNTLLNSPPPNFPTTGNIVMLSFQDEGAL